MLDSYGRLGSPPGRRWFVGAVSGSRLLFLDADLASVSNVEAERLGDEVRSLPADAVGALDSVLIRWLPALSDSAVVSAAMAAVDRSMRRLGHEADVGAIAFRAGEPLRLHRLIDDDIDEGHLVDPTLEQRARTAEMRALLAWGQSIWTPPDYHYRLPSGTHSDTFIRLADAIRHPCDAVALASWALPSAGEGLAVVADSSTMTPIVVALHDVMRRSGLTPGRVALLEQYPPNHVDTYKAVRDVARLDRPVLGLLSVHSTGTVRDRMVDALRTAALGPAHLAVIIDKASRLLPDDVTIDNVSVRTWHVAGAVVDRRPEDCDLCRDPERNRVVQIDPRTFGGMVLPAPDPVMPSALWALQHRQFWELADAANAIVLEGVPDVGGHHPRHGATKRMAVKVDFDRLLADPHWQDFADACWHRLNELESADNPLRDYDAVVIDAADRRRPNFDDFLSDVIDDRAKQVIVFDPAANDRFSDVDAITSADRVLVFRLGAVSGLSLQSVLVAVQDQRRQLAQGAEIDALVCHVRPSSLRQQKTLKNSFGGNLVALWESVLPEDLRSPLQDEHDTLSRVDDATLGADIAGFIDDRRTICSNPGTDDPVLWGIADVDADEARLSPHSVFGENLRARAAYAAIGSAVHEARMHGERGRGAPLWRQFEVSAIVNSYYDPIILACIFRWMHPGEVWWGLRSIDARAAMAHMIQRTGDGRPLLLAELLLAAAEGKVPSPAMEELVTRARAFVAAEPGTASRAVRAGLAVLEATRPASVRPSFRPEER